MCSRPKPSDPISRFAEFHFEPDPDAADRTPRKIWVAEERARSILSHNDSPDLPFRTSLNPYRGCTHACAYCYARTTHEYLGWNAGTDFDTRIVVKVNAAERLAVEIDGALQPGERLAFSGVTDCYQAVESRYRLTRACLEVCVRAGVGVSIVTKSALVERDGDLLAELARGPGADVHVSIPILDSEVAGRIEPGASTPTRRLRIIETLANRGIPTGVLVAPLIPGLGDTEAAEVLRRAAAAGATFAGWMALRLPGSVAEVFESRVRDELPTRWRKIESRVREMRGGRKNDSRFGHRFRGEGPYYRALERVLRVEAERLGLEPRPTTITRGESSSRSESPTTEALSRRPRSGARARNHEPPHQPLLFEEAEGAPPNPAHARPNPRSFRGTAEDDRRGG